MPKPITGQTVAENYENAREAVREARAALEAAEAMLERAKDDLIAYFERGLERVNRKLHGEPLG